MNRAIRNILPSIVLILLSPYIISAQNSVVDVTNSQSNLKPIDMLTISYPHNITIPPVAYENARLGEAHHRGKLDFLEKVVAESTINVLDENTASNPMGWDMNMSILLFHLTGGLWHYENIPMHKLGKAGTHAAQMATNQYSNAYTYIANLTSKNKVLSLKEIRLSEEGKELTDEDPEELLALAGDEYLSCITYGATIAVNFKVHYQNTADKKRLSHLISFKNSNGKTILNPQLNNLDEQTKQSVIITVRALQRGGKPSKLSKLVPQGLTCNLNNPQPCVNALNQAMMYGKTAFSEQLRTMEDYAPVQYRTDRYDRGTIGFEKLVPEGGYPIVPDSTKKTFDNLRVDLKHLSGPKQRALDLINLYQDQMTSEQYDRIRSIYDAILYNEDLYIQTHNYCLENPLEDRCSLRYQETKEMTHPVDFEALQF